MTRTHRTSAQPEYPARTRRKKRTRQHILSTAAKIFYDRGFAAVSMEDAARAADITKPTLYNHFSTKSDLVSESLNAVEDKHFRWFVDQTDAISRRGTLPCIAVFDVLAKWFSTPAFRGCAFINASIQVGSEAPLAQVAVFRHKNKTRKWLTDLCAQSGIPPDRCRIAATQLMTTMEGAIVVAAVEFRTSVAQEARGIAELIVKSHRQSAQSAREAMTSERDALRAESEETTRELEKIRGRHEAAMQRITELEKERDTLRSEAKQLTQDLEQARSQATNPLGS